MWTRWEVVIGEQGFKRSITEGLPLFSYLVSGRTDLIVRHCAETNRE